MLVPVLVFSAIGFLVIGLSIPLLRRRIPPNAWYGLRVPATLEDKDVWYEANAKSAQDLLALGILQLLLALGLPVVADLSPETYTEINAGVIGFGALFAALAGWSRANSLLAARRSERKP